ncbi:DUF4239 domain-containing protein [Paraburkholderia hospita]|uniref:bestrophin-like domain n=1 Tax=Paraburkholderia hospita TaxID=169430 RepID=UPI000B3454A0|nr:DUF4239 domain-containing protein [Paraburkholderia hospita]OUL97335.1 hypothetical protein CA603_03095 [Paraburkholderia hospita]
MNHIVVALIAFLCVFGSALVGSYLRAVLPQHHLSDESTSVVKLATGMIATMAALVLGLLVSSAKGSFDTTNGEIVHSAVDIVRLDRVLAKYGPETREIREQLKRNTAASIALLASGDPALLARMTGPQAIAKLEGFQSQVESLSPHNAAQSQLQAKALQIVDEVFTARWLALLQEKSSIPVPLLVVLVVWLAIIFGTFGLFAPRNGTTITVLVMGALSTAGAIFMILEMNTPLDGVIRVSLEPMRGALAILGQ